MWKGHGMAPFMYEWTRCSTFWNIRWHIRGSFCHRVDLCASTPPAKTVPELCNCTSNQLKFDLQEHPAVTNSSNNAWETPLLHWDWQLALSSGCFVSIDGKGNFCIGLLGLKIRSWRLKLTLWSLPIASVTLQSLVCFVSSSDYSDLPAFQHALLSSARWGPCTGWREQDGQNHRLPLWYLPFCLVWVLSKKGKFCFLSVHEGVV